MGFKFCPYCQEVVETKVNSEGYRQFPYGEVIIKRRKVSHLEEDGGCGHAWYTYEVPGKAVPGFEQIEPLSEAEDE